MRILVIGNGAREHAISYKLACSQEVQQVFVAPGNAGTLFTAKVTNVPIQCTTKEAIWQLVDFAKQHDITYTVVGAELPLVLGIVDEFKKHGLKIWGPTQYCAQLESSKSFAKEFMQKHSIPTARFVAFSDLTKAIDFLTKVANGACKENAIVNTAGNIVDNSVDGDLCNEAYMTFPLVVKADGLAAGKGVMVCDNLLQATNFATDILANNKFGANNNKVVIEEFLQGVEASFIALVAGDVVIPLLSSQDHKRLNDNNTGPNTGGMGAYAPTLMIDDKLQQHILNDIVYPTIHNLAASGHRYDGFLYVGLMIDKQNQAKVVEFNCRLGDPETQPLMLALTSDFACLLAYATNNQLSHAPALTWYGGFSVGVVLAAANYPNAPIIGDVIYGLDTTHCQLVGHDANQEDIKVFHAATYYDQEHKQLLTHGGRVLCVTARAPTIASARAKVYEAISHIKFAGMQYRTDIAANLE